MNEAKRLGRRGFLGVSAATVGVGLGLQLVRIRPAAAATLTTEAAFPDAPATAELLFPDVPDGASVRVWLHIETPEGPQQVDLGRAAVFGGRARVETKLHYPFETRIPGEYSYWVEAAHRGRRAISDQPATYSVRKIWWFS